MVSGELEDLLDYGLSRLETIRQGEASQVNEVAIRQMAEELEIETDALEQEFASGLRYNIKAAYKCGLLDKNSAAADIDTIIGAYTLSFRSALKDFKNQQVKGDNSTPRTILSVAKSLFIIT